MFEIRSLLVIRAIKIELVLANYKSHQILIALKAIAESKFFFRECKVLYLTGLQTYREHKKESTELINLIRCSQVSSDYRAAG